MAFAFVALPIWTYGHVKSGANLQQRRSAPGTFASRTHTFSSKLFLRRTDKHNKFRNLKLFEHLWQGGYAHGITARRATIDTSQMCVFYSAACCMPACLCKVSYVYQKKRFC